MTTIENSDGDPLLGEEVGGYRIDGVIGEGGMGRVYTAVMPLIGARVAIKVLSHEVGGDAEMAERFVAEARIANMVRHGGLVNVIGLGTVADGRPYQMMELLDGASLADLIARGPLPLGSAIEAICEALRALAALHARGIVHRDLKPSNLFVTTAGHVKLIDFGIAKLLSRRGLTRTGQMLGTPEYMAPEQLAGEAVDARADLYALGVVLFEAATGKRPFGDRALDEHALRARLPPTAVAPGLDEVIARATDPDPALRFGDAAEMERALAAVARGLPPAMFRPLVDSEPARHDEPATQPPTVRAVPAARLAVDRLGRYEVTGVIGQGGGGVVMEGFDPVVQRKVALKVLHSKKRSDRLVREAQAMAKVAHPNIVTLYELGDDAGRVFLAMEHVAGRDLATWLAIERPWRDIVAAFVDAGRGLAAAHAGGIVHGDFKPANVLIDSAGRVRVGDFGVAELGGAVRDRAGTPAYMAPERLEGAGDARSDQYAFCASLWEALHGQLPFAGDTAIALAMAARAGEIRAPANPDVPSAVDAVLRRGLAGKPEQRFASMAELLAALERAIAPRARRWPWLAGGVAVIAACALAVTLGVRAEPAPPHDDALVDAKAARDPGDVLRALARVSPEALATDDARRLAAAAATAGPTRQIVEALPVSALAVSEDGRRLAVAMRDAIAVYPLDGGAPVRVRVPGEVTRVRLAADHVTALLGDSLVEAPLNGAPFRYLVHCANAGPGWQWVASVDLRFVACGPDVVDTETNRKFRIAGAPFEVSRGGTRLLAMSDGLEVFDATTGTRLGHHAVSRQPNIATNSRRVAIAEGRTVTVWDPAAGTEHAFDAPFEIKLMLIGEEPDAQLVLAAADGQAGVWSVTGAQRTRLALPGLPANAVVPADPGSNRLLFAFPDELVVKDLATNRDLRLAANPRTLALSRDASVIAVAHGTLVTVWYPDLRAPRSIAIDTSGLLALEISDDGRWLAYPHEGKLLIENLIAGKPLLVLGIADPQRIAFAADGLRVAVVDGADQVWMWGLDTPYPTPSAIGRLPVRTRKLGVIDAARVLAIGDDMRVRVIAHDTVTTPCGDAAGVAMRGALAIVNDRDGLMTCDVERGVTRRLFRQREPGVAVAPDGSAIVALDDQRVRLFRTADGVEEPLPAVANAVTAYPDRTASRIVASVRDSDIVVLERASGRRIVLGGSHGGIGARPSADGSLVAAVVDHTLRMWDVSRPERPVDVGTLGVLALARIAVTPDAVVSISAAIDRHTGARLVCDVWPTGPPTPQMITDWIRRVSP